MYEIYLISSQLWLLCESKQIGSLIKVTLKIENQADKSVDKMYETSEQLASLNESFDYSNLRLNKETIIDLLEDITVILVM